ncbi:YdcF family protein [Halosolutus gelatinilyticus]|uniref:YdcF family protein n=1 Tax=Halosolutus gelatinilyticus TaxID=2931975 RepID=UPI001FF656F2|nr:YdcF family protein [Halosolutus gelatinilyticus]
MVVIVLGQQLRSASHLIFSGGNSNPIVSIPECEAMREYATDRGVDPTRIRLEARAEDTIGNGYFTRRLVDEMRQDVDTIFVVSSCYHMTSAEYVFRQCFGDTCVIDGSRCHDVPNPGSLTSHDYEKLVQLRGSSHRSLQGT